MAGMSLGDRLKIIQDRVESACLRSGRDPLVTRILAVSKFQSVESIQAAYDCGQRDFGENYVQEALGKQKQLSHLIDVRWHYIGRIQSNKAKQMAAGFSLIHSVDRPVVAEALSRHAGPDVCKILLQFNVSDESSKAGLSEDDLQGTMDYIEGNQLDHLSVCGLMVMPPPSEDAQSLRPYFIRARRKLEDMRQRVGTAGLTRHPLNQLSMGTSQDFEVAIEEGATWVRIGTEIFGPRKKAL